MSAEFVYEPTIRIERVRGTIRKAWVPARDEPVTFGVHGAVAEHYGVDPAEYPPDATTIDYLIAAAGG